MSPKRKPAYVDVPVPDVALRREHALAVTHEPAFSKAFLKLSRNLLDSGTKKELLTALKQGAMGEMSVDEIINTVPLFNPADPLAQPLWNMLSVSLGRAIENTVEDAGEAEVRAQGWDFRFKVEKQRKVVPINPFSRKYVKERTAALVSGISSEQRETLRELIEAGFLEGQSPNIILKDIEQIVGLTRREAKAVSNRRALLESKGFTSEGIDKNAKRYGAQLLSKRARRIARTETIMAYTKGLEDSWELAKEQGVLPDNAYKEWIEIAASPRTCKICRGLGGDKVPVGTNFVSEFIGEVDRPPGHSNCRCTISLVANPTDKEVAESRVNAEEKGSLFSASRSGIPQPKTVIGIPAPQFVVATEERGLRFLRDKITGRQAKELVVELDRLSRSNDFVNESVREFLATSVGPEFVEIVDAIVADPDLQDRILDSILRGELPTKADAKEQVRLIRLLLKLIR